MKAQDKETQNYRFELLNLIQKWKWRWNKKDLCG